VGVKRCYDKSQGKIDRVRKMVVKSVSRILQRVFKRQKKAESINPAFFLTNIMGQEIIS